jgi:pheromone shutdown protein TraB
MNIVGIWGTIGFFLCLFIMYGSNHGINGIRKYDENFKLLDMQFRYNSNKVFYTFEKLGIDGRNAYYNYVILDYFFIICFFIVMFAITQRFVQNDILRRVLITFTLLRGIFDVLENILLILLMKQYPTQNILLANVCSWATTIKFTVMFLWILGIVGTLLLALRSS